MDVKITYMLGMVSTMNSTSPKQSPFLFSPFQRVLHHVKEDRRDEREHERVQKEECHHGIVRGTHAAKRHHVVRGNKGHDSTEGEHAGKEQYSPGNAGNHDILCVHTE